MIRIRMSGIAGVRIHLFRCSIWPVKTENRGTVRAIAAPNLRLQIDEEGYGTEEKDSDCQHPPMTPWNVHVAEGFERIWHYWTDSLWDARRPGWGYLSRMPV